MNNIDTLKKIYKPYRYTIKGKTTILETTSGNFVIKNQDKKLIDIYNYLKSRNFLYYPKVLASDRDDYIVYEYIEDENVLNPQKSADLITLVALLHSKTSFNKEVSNEVFLSIYEDISNNINYLINYYQKYYEIFLTRVYPSPSEYEFLRNYSKINAALLFSNQELDAWYDLVKEKKMERICLIHNNLSLDHYLKGDNEYLISWDKSKFDTPILDLYKLYQNDYWQLEFSSLYNKYLAVSSLSEDEEKLFFILISMVPQIDFTGDEFSVCKNMRKKLDYIYKTEEFLKPYYAQNTED